MTIDPAAPRIVATAAIDAEAALMVSRLASPGIKALISGAHTGTAWPGVPPRIQVVVRAADVERALEALANVHRVPRDVSDSA
jgi:hypothetical protein